MQACFEKELKDAWVVKFRINFALELCYLAMLQVGDSLHIGKLMLGFENAAKLVVTHCG